MNEPVIVHQGNGMAVAALVLGIIGSVFALIPVLGLIALPLGIMAIVFGFVGRRRPGGRGMALAGILTGVLALLLSVVGLVIVRSAIEEIDSAIEDLEQVSEPAMEGGEEALADEAEANAGEGSLAVCPIVSDLPVDPFARAGALSALGGTITDSYPALVKDAYERFKAESDAVFGQLGQGEDAELAQVAANDRFEQALDEVC